MKYELFVLSTKYKRYIRYHAFMQTKLDYYGIWLSG